MQLNDENEVDAIAEALAIDEPDSRLLLAQSMLGEDAMEFMTSDLGRYLIGRVNQDRAEAYLQLARVPEWRFWKRLELRKTIEMTEHLMTYFREIILEGRNALAELDKRNTTGEA